MKSMNSYRVYLVVSATTLMAVGILGFAFYDQFHIPAYMLIVDLILGFWGLYVTFSKKKD